MPAKQNLTIEELKSQIKYDPLTGVIYRIARPRGSHSPLGRITTKPTEAGYIRIRILGQKYMVHQLAHFYMTGTWAPQVDHQNRDRSDNRWENLESSSDSASRKNLSLRTNNNTGTTGVIWSESRQRYIVRITNNYKQVWLGQFKTLFAATYARHSANLLYKFHSNHGSAVCKYKK